MPISQQLKSLLQIKILPEKRCTLSYLLFFVKKGTSHPILHLEMNRTFFFERFTKNVYLIANTDKSLKSCFTRTIKKNKTYKLFKNNAFAEIKFCVKM